MYLGQFCGKESIDLEFKEFCLKKIPECHFTEEEIRRIISGHWNKKLNPIIIDNLSEYFKSYVPDCVSSFINSGINGQIYIGCNDNGEVSGIPLHIPNAQYFQNFQYDMEKTIKRELKNRISLSNDTFDVDDNRISPHIRIVVEKLEINDLFIDDEAQRYLKRYYTSIQRQKKALETFRFEKSNWMKKMLKYSCKLELILNSPELRYEIYEFIKENSNLYDDPSKVYNVLGELASERYIHPFPGVNIQKARDNNCVEKLEFWISYFKDTKLDNLMKIRPVKPIFQIPMNPSMIVQRLSILRKRFIRKEKDVSFLLIKIIVDGEKLKHSLKHTQVLSKNQWKSKIRICEKNGPCNTSIL